VYNREVADISVYETEKEFEDMTNYWILGGMCFSLCIISMPFITKITANYRLKKAYGKFNCLFTKAELKFYYVLRGICYDLDLELFAKVRLADLVKVVNKKYYMKYFGKIKSKHIDYVICDRKTLEPLICIELDDNSHRRKDRVERDQFVDTILNHVGYEVIRIKVAYSYNKASIKKQIMDAMKVLNQ